MTYSAPTPIEPPTYNQANTAHVVGPLETMWPIERAAWVAKHMNEAFERGRKYEIDTKNPGKLPS